MHDQNLSVGCRKSAKGAARSRERQRHGHHDIGNADNSCVLQWRRWRDPYAGLTADAAGDLFGTTANGGANGDGTVFELAGTGSGYSAPITLVSFDGGNGANPYNSLIADTAGNLFRCHPLRGREWRRDRISRSPRPPPAIARL